MGDHVTRTLSLVYILRRGGPRAILYWFGRVPRVPQRNLQSVVQDTHGKRVRDPAQYPDAIIPDLSKPDPLVTFTRSDVTLVYGSKWKQRYFKKVGDDYYP